MLPGEIDVDGYIRELEKTIEKLTTENETLKGELESLKKKLLLYENSHTPPSLQPFKPKIDNPLEREAHQIWFSEITSKSINFCIMKNFPKCF